ncbi:MAG: bifunctional 3-(3-hydroxy-phenyl)propionate/3-hydroxycinnamic acid hydroxylase [Solirubrobacterales bacterium]|nr:bifunctional 3-(3-hydroxy-phenyl)propionate/3-hydroxycinnamic acid hydroxylase [Solirubrobacterales bacterium]
MGSVATGARTAHRTADVAIVGYGPVGATAANFLGMYGFDVVVVERDPSVYPRARAISTDEEVLRVWQQVGLAERLKRDMLAERPIDYVDSRGRSFMSFELRQRRNNHPPQMFIYQPVVDEVLREGVERFPNVEVLLEHEMRDLRQDADGVLLELADVRDGAPSTVRAKYVLACDGGSSHTRNLLGIGFEGRTYEDPWLVIDTKVLEPWPEVDRLRFHCDPDRPAVDCPTPLGHHRWEFPILPGEDREALTRPASVRALLARQGITERHVEVLRQAVYVHHVRFAEHWREGRVFLLGDAAHAMPPWIGQGMASGVRDAGNLCWKLAGVLRGTLAEEVLDSYQVERQPNVRELTQRAVFFGRVITERRRAAAAARNVAFRVAMRSPWIGRFLREARWWPPLFYREGFFADRRAHKAIGGHAPQPFVTTADHREPVRLDDVLGADWAVIGLPGTKAISPDVRQRWAAAGARCLELTHDAQPRPGALREEERWLEDWMRSYGAEVIVLRPDRFVYAAAAGRRPLARPPAALCPYRRAVVV